MNIDFRSYCISLSICLFILLPFNGFSGMKYGGFLDGQSQFALSVTGSTNGYGGALVWGIDTYGSYTLRVGYDVSLNSRSIEAISPINVEKLQVGDYLVKIGNEQDYTSGGGYLLFDWHFWRNLYATGGIVLNTYTFEAVGQVEGTKISQDVVVQPGMIGSVEIKADPQLTISPYLGIGFGKTLPEYNRWSAAIEFGFYYIGEPQFQVFSDGIFVTYSETEPINDSIKVYGESSPIYPVLRASISFRL